MKRIKIWYWVFTVLLAALITLSAIPDVLSSEDAVVYFAHLGYPAYLLPFIGVAKLLGVFAVLVPGFSRLKEWAYAGFVFDLLGAIYSGIAVGDPVGGTVFQLICLAIVFGSYYFYHRKSQPDQTGSSEILPDPQSLSAR